MDYVQSLESANHVLKENISEMGKRIDDIMAENAQLKKRVVELLDENTALLRDKAKLQKQNKELHDDIERMYVELGADCGESK